MTAAEDYEPMTPLDYAIELRDKGLRPFPMKRGTKDEFVSESWLPMVASEPTDKMLKLWFGSAERNIGIGTKNSHLLVIDEDGPGELAKVEAEYGFTFPDTYTVWTGKGRHLYYRDDIGILGNRQKYQGRLIDIRGGGEKGGGYVVGPGSLHPDGRMYQSEDSRAEIVALPDAVRAWLSLGKERVHAAPKATDSSGLFGTPDPTRSFTKDEARTYLAREAKGRILAATQGQRNGDVNDAALVVGHFIPTFMSLADGVAYIAKHARKIGLDDEEIAKLTRPDDETGGLYQGMQEPYALRDDVITAESVDEPLGEGFTLPESFWLQTPTLTHIRDAAFSRVCSPDAVLHAVLALLASTVDHRSRVHTGIRPSVLSYFIALIGESGTGKTEALACGRDLMEDYLEKRFILPLEDEEEPYRDEPIGSGEGLIDIFMGQVKVSAPAPTKANPDAVKWSTKWAQVRHNAMAHKDEGREVLAVSQRKGATALPILCELWSGSHVGQANTESGGRRRSVKAGSYALGVMLGFQPGKIDPLFEDEAGGAPQRFSFAMAEHAHLGDLSIALPAWPGQLGVSMRAETAGVLVRLSEAAAGEVQVHRRLKAAGLLEAGPLDGHRMLLRCRIAALLTLLHCDTVEESEIEVPDLMWRLAGEASDVSCTLRDALAGLRAKREARKARAQDKRAVEVIVAGATRVEGSKEMARARAHVLRKLEDGVVLAEAAIRRTMNAALRPLLPAVLETMLHEGLVERGDEGYHAL